MLLFLAQPVRVLTLQHNIALGHYTFPPVITLRHNLISLPTAMLCDVAMVFNISL